MSSKFLVTSWWHTVQFCGIFFGGYRPNLSCGWPEIGRLMVKLTHKSDERSSLQWFPRDSSQNLEFTLTRSSPIRPISRTRPYQNRFKGTLTCFVFTTYLVAKQQEWLILETNQAGFGWSFSNHFSTASLGPRCRCFVGRLGGHVTGCASVDVLSRKKSNVFFFQGISLGGWVGWVGWNWL